MTLLMLKGPLNYETTAVSFVSDTLDRHRDQSLIANASFSGTARPHGVISPPLLASLESALMSVCRFSGSVPSGEVPEAAEEDADQ